MAGSAGSGAGSPGTGGMQPTALDCGATSQWECATYFPAMGCFCNPARPKTAADCAIPFAFTCNGQSYSGGVGYGYECSCQADPLTPDDCELPEQFQCDEYDLYFVGCECNPDAPLSADACQVDCTEFRCHSENPRYGCECHHLGCIK